MNKAYIIKVDGTTIRLESRPSYHEATRIVGGDLEFVRRYLDETLIVDEEGKLKGYPKNSIVSGFPYDYGDIVGDVILLRGWQTVGK